MLKKHRLALGLATALVVLAAGVGAYFAGVWIPNYPPEAQYPIRGIDVSRHQGAIDWSAVPRDRVQFAYIKASEGGDHRDARFAENWRASAAAGVRRGAYHFFTLKTPGVPQAANFTAVVPRETQCLPRAIDLEFAGNSSVRPSISDFRRELEAFMQVVRNFYDREPVIYTTRGFRNRYLSDVPIDRLWIRSVIATPRLPSTQKWLFWQFSEKTRVPGVSGFVDHNVFNGDSAAFEDLVNEGI